MWIRRIIAQHSGLSNAGELNCYNPVNKVVDLQVRCYADAMSTEFAVRHAFHSDQRSPLRFVWSHVRRHPWVGIGMIIGAFANAALSSAVPYYSGVAFNAIIERRDLRVVASAALGIVISQFSRGALQLIRNYASATFGERIERDVRDELYASLLGKSMSYHDAQPVGELMARVTNDVHEINLMFNPGFNLLIGSTMFLITPLLAVPLINPVLSVVPYAFATAYIITQVRYTGRLHHIAQQVRQSFGRMNTRLAEALEGIEVVKGAGQEAQEQANFKDLVSTVRDRFVEQGEIEARYFPVMLLGLCFAAGMAHAIILHRAGIIDTGQIVNYMGQLTLFTFPVFSSLFSLSRVALGYASAERILKVITTKTDLDQNREGYDGEMRGAITFEHVDFGYVPGEEVLHDISFEIYAGHTVALVGQTGSGKTTATKLINRIYDVGKGRVLIDDIDVRDWNLAALRRQISIIEQEIFLFSRSIADNIRFGNHDASMEAVIEAAQKAQAHEFIMSFPDGYDTIIGQRGVTLSGGQRQRLAIARAFLTDPKILILDDSTSAIDSATEDKIQKAIWAAAEGRTTVLITHRLSQIRWADHIIVFRKGRIVAQGTHRQLMESSDSYRRIFARYEERTSRIKLEEVQEALRDDTPSIDSFVPGD